MDRRVLLVVEARADRRPAVVALLRPQPHTVVFAADVGDALTRLPETLPDVVLVAGTPGAGAAGLLEAARASATPVYAAGTDLPGADGSLPWPPARADLERVLREVASRRAATFAAQAMSLDLDALVPLGPPVDEPTHLSSTEDVAAAAASVDSRAEPPPEESTPSDGVPAALVDGALAEPAPRERTNVGAPPSGLAEVLAAPSNTNVGDAPTGLAEVLGVASKTNVGDQPTGLAEALAPVENAQAGAEEDVFASGDAATAPSPPTPTDKQDTDTGRPVPAFQEELAVLEVPERRPQRPGQPVPRVIKLDAPPLAPRLATSSEGPAGPGVRVLDESTVGTDWARQLVDLHREVSAGPSSHPAGVLGVSRGATRAQLDQALMRHAAAFHPDRLVGVNNPVARDAARSVFLGVTVAWRTLAEHAASGDAGGESAFESAAEAAERAATAPPATVRPPSSPPSGRAEGPPRPSVMVDMDGAGTSTASAAEDDARTGSRSAIPPPPRVGARGRTASGAGNTPPLPPPPPVEAVPASPGAAAQAPLPEGDEITEDLATTAGARKFLKLASQSLGRSDLNGARLNLTFALGYEPDNAQIKKRLADVEGRLARR